MIMMSSSTDLSCLFSQQSIVTKNDILSQTQTQSRTHSHVLHRLRLGLSLRLKCLQLKVHHSNSSTTEADHQPDEHAQQFDSLTKPHAGSICELTDKLTDAQTDRAWSLPGNIRVIIIVIIRLPFPLLLVHCLCSPLLAHNGI